MQIKLELIREIMVLVIISFNYLPETGKLHFSLPCACCSTGDSVSDKMITTYANEDTFFGSVHFFCLYFCRILRYQQFYRKWVLRLGRNDKTFWERSCSCRVFGVNGDSLMDLSTWFVCLVCGI